LLELRVEHEAKGRRVAKPEVLSETALDVAAGVFERVERARLLAARPQDRYVDARLLEVDARLDLEHRHESDARIVKLVLDDRPDQELEPACDSQEMARRHVVSSGRSVTGRAACARRA